MRWAFFLCLVACHGAAKDEDDEKPEGPVHVTCAPAAASTLPERVVLRGVVAAPPTKQLSVASPVPGRIAELRVAEGDVVEKGALVAVIEDPSLTAGLGEADAQIATARANAAASASAAARAHRLFDEGIAPRRDVEDADAKAAQGAAELHAAEARRGLASAQRSRSQVRAPTGGTILRLLKRPGELVDGTAQTAIVELADPAHLELRADAPAAAVLRLVPGLFTLIRLDADRGTPLAGRVLAVSPGVDPTTSLGWARIALDGPARLGMTAEAQVLTGARPELVAVPAQAVRRGAEGTTEVLVCDKQTAKIAEVEIAGRSGATVFLSSGLAPGTRIIVDHVLNLEDGAQVVEDAAK